jgi:hypothetical protein
MGKQTNPKRKTLRVSHEGQEAPASSTIPNRSQDPVLVTRKPKENSYYRQVVKLRSTIPHWENLFCGQLSEEERMNDWIRIEVC